MTDSSREKEIELIQGLKTGDNDSFQEAVRAYTPGMLAVARFYLDHSSAEEAVQDCWVKVIDAIHGFEGRSGLKTWLHRVVANRCKNHDEAPTAASSDSTIQQMVMFNTATIVPNVG